MMDGKNTGADGSAAGSSEKVVPLEVVETIRGELQSWKEIAREQQTTIQNLHQAGSTPPKEEDPVVKAFAGMEEDDVLTAGDMKKIVGALTQSVAQASSGQGSQGSVDGRELAVMVENPEYRETITTFLPDLLKSKPHLVSAIRRSDNPYLTAFDLARTSPRYLAAQAGGGDDAPEGKRGAGNRQAGAHAARRAQENLAKPGTGHEAGGSGGGLGKAHEYEAMSDADFEARIAAVKRGHRG